jgi:hypothetical protein
MFTGNEIGKIKEKQKYFFNKSPKKPRKIYNLGYENFVIQIKTGTDSFSSFHCLLNTRHSPCITLEYKLSYFV